MRRIAILLHMLAIALLLAVAPAAAAPSPVAVDMPADFATLAEHQRLVADVMFGGRRIGQFEVETAPGRIRFLDPARVVAAIPGIADPAVVTAALSGPLDTHARALCEAALPDCAAPQPDIAAVVFDPRRFVATLAIAPRYLLVRPVEPERYLMPAGRGATVVDTVAGALAGGTGQRTLYDIRDRAIVGWGDARLAAEASYSSGQGASLDTLAAQLDRPGLRYTAGISYAPGADLVGRRRLIGIGIASQFDTRTDRDQMTGTPLVVFLSQRSRVDLSSQGRLVSSHVYDAGNQALDTSGLPEGSYPVEIRIQEIGGATRTEQRFFTKGAALPPPGRTVFHAEAGLIAVDRPGTVIALRDTPLLTAGAARRVGRHAAWDVAVMATDHKALAEIGASWFGTAIRARAAVLGSSTGDYGALVTAASVSGGRFGYSIDLRHVESRDGRPLIPLDSVGGDALTLSNGAVLAERFTATSYAQATATLSWRIRRAQLGLSAYWRHDAGRPDGYAVGPTLRWPLIQRQRLQLTLDGSYAQTSEGRSVAFGLRLQLFGPRASLTAGAGAQTGTSGEGRRLAGLAELGGTLQRDALGGQLDVAGLVQQGSAGTLVQAGFDERGPAGTIGGTLVRRNDGGYDSIQYGLNGQTMIAATPGALAVGARDPADAAIIVSLGGHARGVRFAVLLDGSNAGTIRPGHDLALSVAPYRRYAVQLRPIGGGLVSLDAGPRTVDVLPGTVAALHWRADPVLAMFGRLVRPDGTPVGDADVTAPGGAIAATDGQGWFQLQAAGDATLTARTGDGRTCRATLAAHPSDKAYVALGLVPCRP